MESTALASLNIRCAQKDNKTINGVDLNMSYQEFLKLLATELCKNAFNECHSYSIECHNYQERISTQANKCLGQ